MIDLVWRLSYYTFSFISWTDERCLVVFCNCVIVTVDALKMLGLKKVQCHLRAEVFCTILAVKYVRNTLFIFNVLFAILPPLCTPTFNCVSEQSHPMLVTAAEQPQFCSGRECT